MLDHKEGWVTKNRCFQISGLEKTLESPLDCKKIKPVNPKGNWSWIFIGKTDTEAPILWPPDEKSLLIGKDPDAGTDWRQEEKGAAEDEMDGQIASPTRGSCIWANSGRYWRPEEPALSNWTTIYNWVVGKSPTFHPGSHNQPYF